MKFKDLHMLDTFFDEKEYKELRDFFAKILAKKYVYKVAMAPRCFHLCYFFAQEEGLEDLERCIISQNALLLYAEELANFYHQEGKFQSILMINDAEFYGDVISQTLYTLEKLVLNYLNKNYPGSKVNQYKIHVHLNEAVAICVYVKPKNISLVDNRYFYEMEAKKELYDHESLLFLFKISRFMLKMDSKYRIASGVFMPSISKREAFEIKSYENIEWHYCMIADDVSKQYFVRSFNFKNSKIFQCIQTEESWITGITLFDSLNLDDLNDCCQFIANYLKSLKDTKYERLIYFLNLEADYQLEPKAQLLSFFLSLVSLYDFVKTTKPDFLTDENWKKLLLEQSDIRKIASNFAKQEDILEPIYAVCLRLDFIMLLKDSFLKENSKKQENVNISIAEEQLIESCAEDIFQKLGMQLEIDAFKSSRNFKPYNPYDLPSNLISLNDYETQMEKEIWRASRITLPQEALIACLLSLAHAGVVYLTIRPKEEERKELSTVILAK